MRVTLTLRDDIHRYLKQQSVATGRTMGDIASDMLRIGLAEHEKTCFADQQGKPL